MRKKPAPSTRQLLHQRATGALRKAANTMAHAMRLGKIPGLREVDRGDCEEKECGVSGRRFNKGWWDANPAMPHCGFIRNDGKKICVLCMSKRLGAVR